MIELFDWDFGGSDPDQPVEVRLTHRDFAGWVFTVRFTASGSPAGFAIDPTPPLIPAGGFPRGGMAEARERKRRLPIDSEPVTARMVRQVPLGALQAEALHFYRSEVEPWFRGLA